MKAVIWGCRGSLPVSITANYIKDKLRKALSSAKTEDILSAESIDNFIENRLPFSVSGTYGCNTSCVELRGADDIILFDSGTGLRDFGIYLMSKHKPPFNLHIFISHLHWDHIHGFPFFTPAYLKGSSINIYGCHANIQEAFINQQSEPGFPVPFSAMNADIKFSQIEPGKTYPIGGGTIRAIEQNHPGKSYGYAFEKNDKKMVYSTDSEHFKEEASDDYPHLDFFSKADLLIMDAQYRLIDALHHKENWGHSSNMICVELASRAKVKHLCMYHSEPTESDAELDIYLEQSRNYAKIVNENNPVNVSLAYDGMKIDF